VYNKKKIVFFQRLIYRYFFRNNFIKNISILLVGSGIAQLVSILAAPLLSRLYSPDDFGKLGIILSFVSLFTVVSNLRYELAIVLPKENNISKIILFSSLFINFLFCLTLTLLLLLFKGFINNYISFNYSVIALISSLVFLNGTFNNFSYFFVKREDFKTNSYSNISRSLFTIIPQISFGFFSFGFIGLLFGQIIGRVISFSYFVRKLLKTKLNFKQFISRKRFLYVVKKYKNFPLYSTPQALLNSVALNSPIYILGFYFSSEIVGLYWFAERLLKLPVNFLSSSLRQVFFQRANQNYNSRISNSKLLKKTTLILATVGIIPLFFLFFFGHEIFEFFFGQKWIIAGDYAKWIGLAWYGIFLNSPSVMILQVYKLQKFYLYYEVVFSVAKIFALIYGGLQEKPILSIAIYSIITFCFNFFLVFATHSKIKLSEK